MTQLTPFCRRYLVLEYVEGGELFHYISRNGRLAEDEAIRIFRQIISGLSYCHRFTICHRDLKPENILMDRLGNVKIVDFGMAALQPANKWLKTSCGSPHYASPEVIQAKNYRGDRADIWSSGIILYAMLTGTLPFDSDGTDHRVVCRLVIQGRYTFPEGMSSHAKDLISRMLQYDPRDRIPMKRMWDHPLLRRYESLDSLDANGNPYIGELPPLTLTDCGPPIRNRKDIDKELLRNLQNLWHEVSEEEVARKLLSDAPNHERVLYSKLLRFREEHLETYQGPTMEYSVSDYHHTQEPARRSSTRASLQSTKRRQSQYSILREGLPRQSHSHTHRRQPSLAATEQSYDPYRPSSKQQMAKVEAQQSHIMVLREPSAGSCQRTISGQGRRISLRNPALARLQGDYSIPNSSSISANSQKRRISSRTSRRSMISNSSARANARKSLSYKRNVSFVHQRKHSNAMNQPTLRSNQASSPFTLHERYSRDEKVRAGERNGAPELPDPPSTFVAADSPKPEITQVVRSKQSPTKKKKAVPDIVLTRSSQYWKDDARKVSTELEKYIDEAFNRSSMQSNTTRTTEFSRTTEEQDHNNNTPATTLSHCEDSTISTLQQRRPAKLTKTPDKSVLQRPLPELPSPEYPGSNELTRKELAKARDLLKQRAADPSIKGSLDDVIAHLDRLMQPSAVRIQEQERRAASTPDPKSPLEKREDTFERFFKEGYTGIRSASEPMQTSRGVHQHPRATVRKVERNDGHEPISPLKPLTIRKKSGSSTPSDGSIRLGSKSSQEQMPIFEDIRPYTPVLSGEYRSAGLSLLDRALEPIEEDDDKENFDPIDRKRKTLSGESKKRGWFRLGAQSQGYQEKDKARTSTEVPQERHSVPSGEEIGGQAVDNIDKQPPIETKTRARGRFFKMFGKRKAKSVKDLSKETSGGKGFDLSHTAFTTNHHTIEYILDDTESIDSVTTSARHPSAYMSGALPPTNASTTSIQNRSSRKTTFSQDTNVVAGPLISRTINQQPQNWLARFLRIKPAVQILCFQISKVRALKQTASIFREWRAHGMRDIVVDKAGFRVFARVSKNNSLKIKEVDIAAEFFTVLEGGRRAGLSVARISQEKGAKSSFETVFEALESLLKARGLLVGEDEGVRLRGMTGVLGSSG